MAAQRKPGSRLALPLKVDWGRVEVVHAASERVVNKLVHRLLVNYVLPVLVLGHLPAHASVAQHADLFPELRVGPVCHSSTGHPVVASTSCLVISAIFHL